MLMSGVTVSYRATTKLKIILMTCFSTNIRNCEYSIRARSIHSGKYGRYVWIDLKDGFAGYLVNKNLFILQYEEKHY